MGGDFPAVGPIIDQKMLTNDFGTRVLDGEGQPVGRKRLVEDQGGGRANRGEVDFEKRPVWPEGNKWRLVDLAVGKIWLEIKEGVV